MSVPPEVFEYVTTATYDRADEIAALCVGRLLDLADGAPLVHTRRNLHDANVNLILARYEARSVGLASSNARTPSATMGPDNTSGPGGSLRLPPARDEALVGGTRMQDRSLPVVGDQADRPAEAAP